MSKYLVMYGVTAVVFLAVDFVWLSVVARGMYADQIGSMLREQPNFAAAGIFYLAFAAGIVYFAVAPAVAQGNPTVALINGAILGVLAYATYDVTNYSTLKDWPIMISVIDTLWGTALTGLAAFAGYWGTQALTGAN